MRVALYLLMAVGAYASTSSWLESVDPIISSAEKKAYVALTPSEREEFETNFWLDKSISAEEYDNRLAYIDSKFGSSKRVSGANTDPGRVWLSLGAPDRVQRIPSSRIFVPLEIWYYNSVPGILNTELRLIFYQNKSVGLLRLYSPTLDTIRTLLIPQAATRSMFGPNSVITESDIRKVLRTGPAEDEVISAAVDIAPGIKGSGNDEILMQITSPRRMLSRKLSESIKSRLILTKPELAVFETVSPYGGSQVDLKLTTSARREIAVEVQDGSTAVYRSHLQLGFSETKPLEYTHRLDLLPGAYRILFTVDGVPYVYLIEAGPKAMGEIRRFEPAQDAGGRETPFAFDMGRIDLNPWGSHAAVALGRAGKVNWLIRKGTEVVWRASSTGEMVATIELPLRTLASGSYQLEAVGAEDNHSLELIVKRDETGVAKSTVLSFNANLGAARRLAFLGHQWLLRGNMAQARRYLDSSVAKGITDEARIELARMDALNGNLDQARVRARDVLATRPDDFDALSVLAYIEARFQDYPVAAELYRRALAVQESPPLREALAKLPNQ